MKKAVRLAASTGIVLALATLAVPGIAGAANKSIDSGRDASHVVFVQTDNTTGNQVVAYDRSPNGALTYANAYDTGGLGGVLNGSVVDHLASQGSLTYDRAHGLLFAVNAGSNSVSVFTVHRDHLELVQQAGSGGTFPVSVATNGRILYVLNALDGGSVSGFRIGDGRLTPIPGSARSLGLTIPTDGTQFTHTPGQVAFSPDGDQLIVTTKATTNSIDVFEVNHGGQLSSAPVVNAEPGTVPFAISFDQRGDLAIANAGTNALSTFRLNSDGTVTSLDTVLTGQAATCWVAPARGFLFASNAGSPSESGFQVGEHGQLDVVSTTTTDKGAVDAAASSDGRFLYVQAGLSGNVDEFSVNGDGSLTSIGLVTVPGAAGGEGIVAF
jgi:6-phosphogluconolactonase (cycloisomerase 2 family)